MITQWNFSGIPRSVTIFYSKTYFCVDAVLFGTERVIDSFFETFTNSTFRPSVVVLQFLMPVRGVCLHQRCIQLVRGRQRPVSSRFCFFRRKQIFNGIIWLVYLLILFSIFDVSFCGFGGKKTIIIRQLSVANRGVIWSIFSFVSPNNYRRKSFVTGCWIFFLTFIRKIKNENRIVRRSHW